MTKKIRELSSLLSRFIAFYGIASHLAIAGLLKPPLFRRNLRAAWRQGKHGWQDAMVVWDMSDEELDAWISAMEEM